MNNEFEPATNYLLPTLIAECLHCKTPLMIGTEWLTERCVKVVVELCPTCGGRPSPSPWRKWPEEKPEEERAYFCCYVASKRAITGYYYPSNCRWLGPADCDDFYWMPIPELPGDK